MIQILTSSQDVPKRGTYETEEFEGDAVEGERTGIRSDEKLSSPCGPRRGHVQRRLHDELASSLRSSMR